MALYKNGKQYTRGGDTYKASHCECCNEESISMAKYVDVWADDESSFERKPVWECQLCRHTTPRQTRKSAKSKELDALINELTAA